MKNGDLGTIPAARREGGLEPRHSGRFTTGVDRSICIGASSGVNAATHNGVFALATACGRKHCLSGKPSPSEKFHSWLLSMASGLAHRVRPLNT